MKKIWGKVLAFFIGVGALLVGVAYLLNLINKPKQPEINVAKEHAKIDAEAKAKKEEIKAEAEVKKESIVNSSTSEIIDSLDDATKGKIDNIIQSAITNLVDGS